MSNTRDPSTFSFNQEERDLIEEKMKNVHEKCVNIDDNLSTDRVKVRQQNYALISIVTDEKTECQKMCLKIRGVFETMEQAQNHVKRIQQEEQDFDIYVVSMYEWLLLPPPKENIDQQFIDEDLNTLISQYKLSQEQSKIEFDLRKDILKGNKLVTLVEENDTTIITNDDDGGVLEEKENDDVLNP